MTMRAAPQLNLCELIQMNNSNDISCGVVEISEWIFPTWIHTRDETRRGETLVVLLYILNNSNVLFTASVSTLEYLKEIMNRFIACLAYNMHIVQLFELRAALWLSERKLSEPVYCEWRSGRST